MSNQSMTLGVALVDCLMVAASISVVGFVNVTRDDSFQVPDGLPIHHIEGSTDLPGNFYISFVYTQNIMMLDRKGDIVWAKHTDHKDDGVKTVFLKSMYTRYRSCCGRTLSRLPFYRSV